jgi:hypothetical protein
VKQFPIPESLREQDQLLREGWSITIPMVGESHMTPPKAIADALGLQTFVRAIAPLDAAWAEAEAALPEGWWFEAASRGFDGYLVKAKDGTMADGRVVTLEKGFGDTPAAALRELAAKLRARSA